MFKNSASQNIALFAFDISTGAPKTGDSANMLYYVAKDFGAVTAIASNSGVPTEVDSTNAKGWYKIALAQAETNADNLLFTGKSSTASVSVVGRPVDTFPVNFTTASFDGSGRVDIGKIVGSAVDTTSAQLGVRLVNIGASAVDTTSPQLGVRVNNIVAAAVDTTLPQLGVRLVNVAAAAVSSTVAQIGVNLVNIAGTAVDTTSPQIGVRLNNIVAAAVNSTTAQLGVNLVNIAGAAVNSASAQLGANVVTVTAGAVTSTAFTTDAIGSTQLGATAVIKIADGLLDRDMSLGADNGSTTVRTTRQALRFLRNKWSIAAGTLTVTKEDDTATSWTGAITTDSTALPITASDPAG